MNQNKDAKIFGVVDEIFKTCALSFEQSDQ